MKEQLNTAIFFFALLVSIADVCWGAPTETMIAGRPVGTSLVKADDLSPAPWPDEVAKLTTETATVQANSNIYDLLSANGVEPDVEAFAVVYDLNPSLVHIDPLSSGANVVLPKILAGDKLQDKLRHGYLAMLTVDSGLRQELAISASKLQYLSDRFAGLASDRFASASARELMLSNIKALVGWFAYIQKTFLQRTGPPLRRQTLVGLRDEAVALDSLLSAIVGAQQNVTAGDVPTKRSHFR